MARTQEPATLEWLLTEAQDSFRSRLREFLAAVPKETGYPVTIAVLFEDSIGGRNSQIVKLVVNACPRDVGALVDEVRRLIVDATDEHPTGTLRFRAWSDGQSESPGINYRRVVSAPGYQIDGEKEYLRGRVKDLEAQLLTLVGQVAAFAGQALERNVGLTDAFQKLATVRTAASSSAEVSPVTLMVAAVVLPAVLPQINRAMGIRPDAPITETMRAAQLMTGHMIQSATRQWTEPAGDVQQLETPRATVRQLASDPPAPDAAPAPPPPALETLPAWPEPAALVSHMGEDAQYRERVVAEILAQPLTRAALREQLPMITLALEMSA